MKNTTTVFSNFVALAHSAAESDLMMLSRWTRTYYNDAILPSIEKRMNAANLSSYEILRDSIEAAVRSDWDALVFNKQFPTNDIQFCKVCNYVMQKIAYHLIRDGALVYRWNHKVQPGMPESEIQKLGNPDLVIDFISESNGVDNSIYLSVDEVREVLQSQEEEWLHFASKKQ